MTNGVEQRDVHPRGIGVAVLIIVGGIVAALAASWGVSVFYGNPNGTNGVTPLHIAGPVEEVMRGQALSAYRAEKNALLQSYGWLDRDAGRARIPIEEAMRLMAEGGSAREEPRR